MRKYLQNLEVSMISIKYDKKATLDLEEIYLTILKDKKSAADSFVNKIDSYILLLKTNPEMGKDCKESGFNRDCRVLYYKNYTILYKIYENHISIKRILNSKQNYKGN